MDLISFKIILNVVFRETVRVPDIFHSYKNKTKTPRFVADFLHISLKIKTRLFTKWSLKLSPCTPYRTKHFNKTALKKFISQISEIFMALHQIDCLLKYI